MEVSNSHDKYRYFIQITSGIIDKYKTKNPILWQLKTKYICTYIKRI